jgi:hypothetical protein
MLSPHRGNRASKQIYPQTRPRRLAETPGSGALARPRQSPTGAANHLLLPYRRMSLCSLRTAAGRVQAAVPTARHRTGTEGSGTPRRSRYAILDSRRCTVRVGGSSKMVNPPQRGGRGDATAAGKKRQRKSDGDGRLTAAAMTTGWCAYRCEGKGGWNGGGGGSANTGCHDGSSQRAFACAREAAAPLCLLAGSTRSPRPARAMPGPSARARQAASGSARRAVPVQAGICRIGGAGWPA